MAAEQKTTRELNQQIYDDINIAVKQWLQNHGTIKSYKVLKILNDYFNDISANAFINAKIHFTYQTFAKLGCRISETKLECDTVELSNIRTDAGITSGSVMAGLMTLELLWSAFIFYQQRRRRSTEVITKYKQREDKIYQVKDAIFDVFTELFMTHQLTMALAHYVFLLNNMSTGGYIGLILTPALLLAVIVSPKAKELLKLTKCGAAVNVVFDFIQGVFQMAGRFHLVYTTSASLLNISLKSYAAKDILYGLDAGVGVSYGVFFSTAKNCLPIHKSAKLMKIAYTLDSTIYWLIQLCMLNLAINWTQELAGSSVGMLSAIWGLIVFSILAKQIFFKGLQPPVQEQINQQYQPIQDQSQVINNQIDPMDDWRNDWGDVGQVFSSANNA